MTGTVPRVHPARLPFGRGHICMRNLPLHTDGELKHQEHRNHPVSEPVTHGSEPTPRAAMGEEALFCRKPGRASICASPECILVGVAKYDRWAQRIENSSY
jgi:hypothetical protein